MSGKLKILHLEDMPTDAELVSRELKRSSIVHEKLLVDNKADYTAALKEFVPDIILSDHSLPSFDSIEALKILKKTNLNIPFILITATISEEFAVTIMKDGASDYILKDRMQRLPNAILNALEKFKFEAERRKYMQEVIASEALLKEAENIADIGSLDFNLKTQITKWSPGLYRILGLNIGEVEPSFKSFFNHIHPDDRYRITREIDYGIANLNEILLDFRVQSTNENIKYLHAKLLVETDTQGHPVRVKGFTQDITERRDSEKKLDSANRELNMLFNTIDEVFFSRDVIQSKLIQISPACEKVYGYSPHEFLTNHYLWEQIIHPGDNYIKEDNIKKLNEGETVLTQYRIIHKNKSIRWLESKMIPNLSEAGTLLRLYGVTRDITERKSDEELIERNHVQLQEASETQAAILNALPPNIVLINEKGKIIAVNESWKKLSIQNNLGMPNYGIGYNYLAISEKATGVDKVNSNKIAYGIKEVIAGNKKEFTLEYASLTEKKWYQVVIAPLADNTHKGAVILHINITDKKLAEASLLQSEANLRSVFENIDLSIILFDTDLKIVSYNSNAIELATKHFDRKLKTGAPAFLYCEKERKPFLKQIIKRINNGEMVFYEKVYVNNEGVGEWYDVKWVGVVNQKMEDIGVILTLKNITEKKSADIEREKITSDLVKRNNDLEQFTYIISHNLRAPVANIQGLSNLLNDYELGDPESKETLQALSISVGNLDKVILDLNHILQIRSQVNDQIELVSLPLLVEEIRSGISQMMLRNKVTLTCNFDEIDELFILKGYLYSIFQNLVINSIKYRRIDADPVINIRSKVNGDKVCIYFEDNGKGIDLNKYGLHLFGLYKRFDWSVEGKGVGLFMVKMQVESLGGTISVHSELNTGTEFKIEFPIVQEQMG